jgi:hypothetical protein
MNLALMLLAVAGFAAAAVRAAVALFMAVRSGVDSFLARDLAESRGQRGDLTGLADATALRQTARRRRFVALGVFALWAALLIVPPLTPWPLLLYAGYSLLWLVPRRRTPTGSPHA